ncbi:MAG: NAD(P)H-dependent oxidoreductase [Alphaproteobacteria bacterium]|jgi:glutathione-regulated potassium-efflux system ancillary protein KefG|nr:NAD(P)H-dependent oxidoreductase [Alphaproteobacteria bacterium]
MKKTLVIVGHQNYEKSVHNKKLAESLKDLPNITVHILKENFDVAAEQKLLEEHDNIVIQFPFTWYNLSPLFKSWFDKIFVPGFAYGEFGSKLEGKTFAIVNTTASLESAYTREGHNKFTVKELLSPTIATIAFVRGNLKGIFTVHGCMPNGISAEDLTKKVNEYKEFVANL